MAFKRVLIFAFVVAINVTTISGHGKVMDPVNRGSAWRKGFDTPKNYNDMGNFCGGYAVQYSQNGGKCGLCGDSYSDKQPRDNENGGLYGTGTIVKTYKAGEKINVEVDLSAAHLGYFEFSLCPLKTSDELETEECFNAHKLKIANGGYKYTEVTGPKIYKIEVILPKDLKCEHCVLRWHYRTGNTWGICENGTGANGCGDQEVFRTCSDIKIV